MPICQSPIPSDQVPLDISRMKGIMLNIKFTYLKIAGVTWDFCFSRVIQNILKQQYKCKLHSAKYSNCNIWFNHNTNLIPITGLYKVLAIMTLGIPSDQKGIHVLKPAQAHCSLQNTFAGCLVFVPYVGLSHLFTPPMLVWLTLLMNFYIYTLLMNF